MRERRHRRDPLLGLLRERPADDRGEARRHVGAQREQVRRRLVDVAQRDRDEVLPRERDVARQQLPEHDRERVDVRRRRDGASPRLFGGEVGARSHHGSGLRDADVHLERACDPEVRHLDVALGVDQDVLRLDVAVDEAVRMRERERVGARGRELERATHRQRPGPADELLQVLAGDVLEDDVLAAGVLATVDHGDDVRVRQLRDRPRLAPEPLDGLVVAGVVRVQQLERHVAVEQAVACPVDGRHSTAADELLQLVAVGDHRVDRHGAAW